MIVGVTVVRTFGVVAGERPEEKSSGQNSTSEFFCVGGSALNSKERSAGSQIFHTARML